MKKAYSVAGVVLLGLLALQFYFIAAAALQVWGADNQDDTATSVFGGFKVGDTFANLHSINGTVAIPLVILAMIGLSFGARLATRLKWQSAALFGLLVIQAVLAWVGSASGTVAAVIGGLHGVNALLIVGLAGSLVYRTWAFGKQPAIEAAAAAPDPVPALAAEKPAAGART
jgi:hypothetical protein